MRALSPSPVVWNSYPVILNARFVILSEAKDLMVIDQAEAKRRLTRRKQTPTSRFTPDRQYSVYSMTNRMTNRSRTLCASVTPQ